MATLVVVQHHSLQMVEMVQLLPAQRVAMVLKAPVEVEEKRAEAQAVKVEEVYSKYDINSLFILKSKRRLCYD
jgi:hypothetical protein